MAEAYVYGISSGSADNLVVTGIVTDLSVTSSGTEQTLPGQKSSDQNADSGTTDISTKVSLTVRGSAISSEDLKLIAGSTVAVSISSEGGTGNRQVVGYSFNIKVSSAAVTAKARDWWDVKIDGTVVWA